MFVSGRDALIIYVRSYDWSRLMTTTLKDHSSCMAIRCIFILSFILHLRNHVFLQTKRSKCPNSPTSSTRISCSLSASARQCLVLISSASNSASSATPTEPFTFPRPLWPSRWNRRWTWNSRSSACATNAPGFGTEECKPL